MAFGEPVSSNDSSDDDDSVAEEEEDFPSEADDPFSFKKHSFSRKRKAETESSDDDDDSSEDDDSSPVNRRSITKKKRGMSVEDRLSALQKRKRAAVLSSDGASDDSDVEVVEEAPAQKAPKQQEVEFLSSDDEEVVPSPSKRAPSYSSASLEGVKAIQKARDARRALVRAQQYHAEDIRVAMPPPEHLPHNPMVSALHYEQIPPFYVPMQPMLFNAVGAMPHAPLPPMVQPMFYPPQVPVGVVPAVLSQARLRSEAAVPPPARASSPPKATKNLGKTIMLTLRTREFVNGKPTTSSPTDIVFPIRILEPLQRLLDKYLKARDLTAASTKVILTFDGRQLQMNKTPASYEMEDDDLVDVVAKTISIPNTSGPRAESKAAPKAASSLGPEILLTLRIQNVSGGKKKVSEIQDVLSIRKKQALSVLLEKFRKKRKLGSKRITMTFDGLPLDLSKTPMDFDMEDEDMIDVTVKH